jgi:hypothetical protein
MRTDSKPNTRNDNYSSVDSSRSNKLILKKKSIVKFSPYLEFEKGDGLKKQ